MTIIIPLKIENEQRETIAGTLRVPQGSRIPCPTVIMTPSLFGGLSSKLVGAVGVALLNQGIAVVQYESISSLDSSPRKSRHSPSLSHRSSELGWVITHLFERMFQPGNVVDIRKLGLFGHGFGAAVSLHRAARDTRIRALGLASPMAALSTGLSTTVLDAWKRNEDGTVRTPNGGLAKLPRSFQIDWLKQGRTIISESIEQLKVPVSIVFGEDSGEDYDSDARRLYFRQPRFARLKTYQANENFVDAENRVASFIGSFFDEQWPIQTERAIIDQVSPSDDSSPRTVL